MIELTPETSPAVQALLADSRERESNALSAREFRAEAIVGGAFLLVAVAMATLLDSGRDFDLTNLLIVYATLVVASLIIFEVGAVYTWPGQVAFVPSLFLLPPALVPLVVAAALISGKLLRGTTLGLPPPRALMGLGDSWFAVGPAIVLLVADAPAASTVALGTLLLALAAQFIGESISARVRELLHRGASLREQLLESAWIYSVDALLSCIGFAVALACDIHPAAALLVLPLFGVIAFLARDRRRRINSVLELSDAYRGTARMLSSVISYDDAYTGSHSRGVTDLAARVAEHLGLSPVQCSKVEFGAMLHDVGKIAISKEIINKPGSLTDDEWALMRTHTIEGQRMLDQVGGLMSEIGRVVRWSHESYDGSGYPDGLKGEEIPIEARVVFTCDSFSAMTSDRPYQRAMNEYAAIAELRAHTGTQFDPAVVEALIAVLETKPGQISETAKAPLRGRR